MYSKKISHQLTSFSILVLFSFIFLSPDVKAQAYSPTDEGLGYSRCMKQCQTKKHTRASLRRCQAGCAYVE